MPDSLPQVAQTVTPISAAPTPPAESPEIPSMFQDLRVKVSNLATKAGNMLDTAGKVADKVVPGMHQVDELGKTPVGQKVQHDVMNDLTETVTNPEKRLNFLMGAVQPGGEADPFEGLRVKPSESAKQTNWEQVLRDSGLGMNAGKVKTENVGTPTSAQEVLKDMVRSYGANSDVQGVKNGASFITKDGKFVYLPADHPQTLFKHGYDAKSDDDRVPFVNESGAVRTNFRKGSDSDTLAVSVPNKKVTPEQVESIRRAVGAVRNGTLLLETADKPSSIRSQVKQFASVRDVDGMLKSLGVHPEQAKAEKFDSTGTSTVESNPESRWSYKNKPTGAAVDKFTKQNKEILKNKDLSVGYVKESEGRPYKLTVRKADSPELGEEESRAKVAQIRAGDARSKNKGNVSYEGPTGKLKEADLPVSSFTPEHLDFLRDSTDAGRVSKYAKEKPDAPIYATPSKKNPGKFIISDGGHRLLAAVERGDKSIKALVPAK